MDEMKDIYLVEVVARKASPVSVTLQGKDRVVASSSQIKYKGKRYTLTNHHVCRVASRFMDKQIAGYKTYKRGKNTYKVTIYKKITDNQLVGQTLKIGDRVLKILALDTEHDLCIMEPDLTRRPLYLAANYHNGEKITVIGHPRGLPQTIREGRILGDYNFVARWLPNKNVIRSVHISAISYGGNSGSPVVNRFGNLVGVLFAGDTRFHTEAYIVPLENVKIFLDKFND